MTLLRDIAKELLGMFLGDAKLSGAILALVVAVAILIRVVRIDPFIGGALLLSGCLTVLVIVTRIEARRR